MPAVTIDVDQPAAGTTPPGPVPADGRPGAAQAVGLLARRTADATRQRQFDALAGQRRPCWVVGAGGSYAAAAHIARTLRAHGRDAHVTWPLEIVDMPDVRDLIVVTYSGTTADVAAAIGAQRARRPDTHVTVITGNADTPLATGGPRTVLAHRQDGADAERGYISFAGTLAPAAAAAGTFEGAAQVRATVDDALAATLPAADQVGRLLAAHATVDVIWSGWSHAAALDVESKATEAQLGTVRLHQAKDLSHGRHISVFDQDVPGAVVHLTSRSPSARYTDELADVLDRHAHVVRVRTGQTGPLAGLALLAAVQLLGHTWGQARGFDISRPAHIPADGIDLYAWDWDLG